MFGSLWLFKHKWAGGPERVAQWQQKTILWHWLLRKKSFIAKSTTKEKKDVSQICLLHSRSGLQFKGLGKCQTGEADWLVLNQSI